MQRDKAFVYEEKEETKRLQLHELPPERITEQEKQFSIGHNKLNGASRQSDSPLSNSAWSFLQVHPPDFDTGTYSWKIWEEGRTAHCIGRCEGGEGRGVKA
jgi:hypothetical protein